MREISEKFFIFQRDTSSSSESELLVISGKPETLSFFLTKFCRVGHRQTLVTLSDVYGSFHYLRYYKRFYRLHINCRIYNCTSSLKFMLAIISAVVFDQKDCYMMLSATC